MVRRLRSSLFLAVLYGCGTKVYASSAIVQTTLAALDSFLKTSPYAAAAITCGVKASAADIVAQKHQYRKQNEKSSEVSNTDSQKWDAKRNLAYVIYGSIYQGMAQEYIYNHVYPVWFGTGNTVTVVLAKVLFDLLGEHSIGTTDANDVVAYCLLPFMRVCCSRT
jgi:hypothetical protein